MKATYNLSHIDAGSLLVKSRGVPVVAGNNSHFDGAGKLTVMGSEKMLHLSFVYPGWGNESTLVSLGGWRVPAWSEESGLVMASNRSRLRET